MVPKRIPAKRPEKMTIGVKVRVNVPMEKGTVRPSRRKYARMKARSVPVRVASSDS